MREVKVYNSDVLAGVLIEVSPTEYVFRYDDEYLSNLDMPAISVTLPKTRQTYTSPYLFPFFSNMIPEGANRRALCLRNKIDERDLFGILMAVRGWDFIGDVSIR